MPFQLSPGVNVTEIDLTTVVPAVASSDGAIAGIFNWGPVAERILIDTEDKLKTVFGKPTTDNAETWFTAANFLSYSNRLYVVRAADTTSDTGNTAYSAVANTGTITGGLLSCIIKNNSDFQMKNDNLDPDVNFIARYPGAIGNSLKISICDSANAFSSPIYTNASDYSTAAYYVDVTSSFSLAIGNTSTVITTISGSANAAAAQRYANTLVNELTVGDYFVVGNSTIGLQYMQIANVGTATSGAFTINFNDSYKLHTSYEANDSVNMETSRTWEYFNVVDTAPKQTDYVGQFGNTAAVDGIHVVVVDEDGKFTGTPGTILETYGNLSRATNAKTVGGADNFYKTVINQSSQYVWAVNDFSGFGISNTALNVTSSPSSVPFTISFAHGDNGYSESTTNLATIAAGYDMFGSAEDVDISLILQGKPIGGTTASGGMTVKNFQLANYLIDNIAENRKDCVVFISPDDSVVSGNINNEAIALVNWRNVVHDSSYAVMDSGYKYQYDKYNDVYRYLPTNGDVAGLCARTDNQKDPWWSPAGFNRGQIKNLVKLRFNPRKADRDIIYKNGINPVATFPGQGTVLFGDKTLQSKPSAFDRINVRRLFIVLEKAISTASKFTLFEFNDEFTRAQFKNLVTPFLRDVQGRRGITDFLVVCDGTNNTPERVDRNEFWGDIYIKPARSINFIQLNFVAVRTGVQFSEIVGQF